MKTPDPSNEPRRTPYPRTVAVRDEPGPARSAEREEEEFEPKYLSLPLRRTRGQGRRNLTLGVVLLLFSAMLFGWALYLAGPGAMYTIAISLATATALYVVARSRLLRQRNGAFLTGAIVCLLSVFFVLVQQAWMAAVRGGPERALEASRASVATPAPAVPALIEVYRPSPAELDSGPIAKMTREIPVPVLGKTYLLRVGDVFPVGGSSRDEVRLAVGMQEVSVPPNAVEITDPTKSIALNKSGATAVPPGATRDNGEPSEADLRRVTEHSQADAMRKYPALGVRGSPENQSFLEAFQELKLGGQMSFFENPEWPMRLADQLAAREGWGDKEKAVPGDRPREDRAPSEPPPDTADRSTQETGKGSSVVRPPVPGADNPETTEPLTARPQ